LKVIYTDLILLPRGNLESRHGSARAPDFFVNLHGASS
jgi:hypothetical protein